MIFLSGEQSVRRGEQLKGALPATFLIAAMEMVDFLPGRRFDDGHRDFTAGEHRFERAHGAAILEAAGGALLGHRLRAFYDCSIWLVLTNKSAERVTVDTLLGTDTGDRNVDRADKPRSIALAHHDDGATAANSRINTKDPHDQMSFSRLISFWRSRFSRRSTRW